MENKKVETDCEGAAEGMGKHTVPYIILSLLNKVHLKRKLKLAQNNVFPLVLN